MPGWRHHNGKCNSFYGSEGVSLRKTPHDKKFTRDSLREQTYLVGLSRTSSNLLLVELSRTSSN